MPLEAPPDFRLLLVRLLLVRLLLRVLPLPADWPLRLAVDRRAAAALVRLAVPPREDCFFRELFRAPVFLAPCSRS